MLDTSSLSDLMKLKKFTLYDESTENLVAAIKQFKSNGLKRGLFSGTTKKYPWVNGQPTDWKTAANRLMKQPVGCLFQIIRLSIRFLSSWFNRTLFIPKTFRLYLNAFQTLISNYFLFFFQFFEQWQNLSSWNAVTYTLNWIKISSTWNYVRPSMLRTKIRVILTLTVITCACWTFVWSLMRHFDNSIEERHKRWLNVNFLHKFKVVWTNCSVIFAFDIHQPNNSTACTRPICSFMYNLLITHAQRPLQIQMTLCPIYYWNWNPKTYYGLLYLQHISRRIANCYSSRLLEEIWQKLLQ